MSRICSICADPERAELVRTWITEGVSDREISTRLGFGSDNKSMVSRHRKNHVILPMKQKLQLIERGAAERRERKQLAEAVAADAPTPQQFVEAFFGLKAQAEKLQQVEDRLARMAADAEQNRSSAGVAALAGQQLKSIQVGGQLAALPGFVPARTVDQVGHTNSGPRFSVSIIFANAGKSETISVSTPTIEGREEDAQGVVHEVAHGTTRAPRNLSARPAATEAVVNGIVKQAKRAARHSEADLSDPTDNYANEPDPNEDDRDDDDEC